MGAMVSQITSISIVCSAICSGTDQRKHQSSVTGLGDGNSPVTDEFPSQRASIMENASILWCHHENEWNYKFVGCNGMISSLNPLTVLWNVVVWLQNATHTFFGRTKAPPQMVPWVTGEFIKNVQGWPLQNHHQHLKQVALSQPPYFDKQTTLDWTGWPSTI